MLVPSTMRLFGAANWWLPGWLDRIIPNLNVEGGEMPLPDAVDDHEPVAAEPATVGGGS